MSNRAQQSRTGRQPEEGVQSFVDRLKDLSAGELARLKRGAGKQLDDPEVRGETRTQFYRILPSGASHVEAYFLIATLFPLVKRDFRNHERTLGHTLRACRTALNGPGLDRRVETLLDADERQLPYRLRRAVQYVAAQDRAVSWTRLLTDVQGWRYPERRGRIRRQWAEAYFVAPSAEAAEDSARSSDHEDGSEETAVAGSDSDRQ